MHWYSNERWVWIVVRGLLAVLLGAIAVTLLDLNRISWIAVVGVPTLLTLFNLIAWYKVRQRRAPQALDRS